MKITASFALVITSAVVGLATLTSQAATVTFEELLSAPESFRNGSDVAGKYTSGNVELLNSYSGGFWSGFAISNTTDTTTPGFGNQYSAFTGTGADGSSDYAVSYSNSTMRLTTSQDLSGLGASFTNTTYTALDVLNGSSFSRAFTTGDWLKLTITGTLNSVTTNVIDLYLVDYRTGSEILSTWKYIDFTPLGTVDELRFTMSSTDNHPTFGMNTPAYFAIDSVLAVPEVSSLLLFCFSALGLSMRRR